MAVELESEKIARVLELVEGMSVLEASQLIKAFEQKFGVSAYATVIVPVERYEQVKYEKFC